MICQDVLRYSSDESVVISRAPATTLRTCRAIVWALWKHGKHCSLALLLEAVFVPAGGWGNQAKAVTASEVVNLRKTTDPTSDKVTILKDALRRGRRSPRLAIFIGLRNPIVFV